MQKLSKNPKFIHSTFKIHSFKIHSLKIHSLIHSKFGSLTIFAKKARTSSNVVLTHCHSVTYFNGLKTHWRKMQKLSKNPKFIHSTFKIHSLKIHSFKIHSFKIHSLKIHSLKIHSLIHSKFGSLTIFAKKARTSSNVVLTHCHSVTYFNGLKPHWRKMQKLSKNPKFIHSFIEHLLSQSSKSGIPPCGKRKILSCSH